MSYFILKLENKIIFHLKDLYQMKNFNISTLKKISLINFKSSNKMKQ